MLHEAEIAVFRSGDDRAAPRRLVNFAASLREMGATASKVEILDLSSTGCRIRGCELTEWTEVWLKISGLNAVRGRVVWVDGLDAGCEFQVPLHPSAFAELAARSRPARQQLFGQRPSKAAAETSKLNRLRSRFGKNG